MILHTIADPYAVMYGEPQSVSEFERISPFCCCEWVLHGRDRELRRIISTDLRCYLDAGLQPGTLRVSE